jgi:hypothetical protein
MEPGDEQRGRERARDAGSEPEVRGPERFDAERPPIGGDLDQPQGQREDDRSSRDRLGRDRPGSGRPEPRGSDRGRHGPRDRAETRDRDEFRGRAPDEGADFAAPKDVAADDDFAPDQSGEPADLDVPATVEEQDDEQLFEPSDQGREGEGRGFGEGSGRRRRRRRGRGDRPFDRGERGERDDRFPPRPQPGYPPPTASPQKAEHQRSEHQRTGYQRAEPNPAPVEQQARARRHGEAESKQAWTPAAPGTSSRPTTATQRVALFVDVEAMQREARTIGGQVAFSRALRQIAGPRAVARAIAYCTPQSRGTGGAGGFETVRVDSDAETPVAIAVDALATAARVDCVVIAPESAASGPLVRALRAHGVRVESAGFEARGRSEVADHQRLGKEALFVP